MGWLVITDEFKKTKEMEKYEKETGRKAIWKLQITDGFKKWKKGEKSYNLDRERIAFYVKKGTKNEWIELAKSNNFTTLSQLMREALIFFTKYKSDIIIKTKNVDIDLFSSLSHHLKEPLTSIKSNLQLIVKKYKDNMEENITSRLQKVLSQCLILENRIIESLDNYTVKLGEKVEIDKMEYDILIIEDDIETLNFLINYFEDIGVRCKGFLEGNKGLKKIKSSNPKLILLDIILPDTSGYEIMKQIREAKILEDVPIFFLTAIPSSEVEKKAQEFKVTGTIYKPFELTDLNDVLKYFK